MSRVARPAVLEDRGHCENHGVFMSSCRNCIRAEAMRIFDIDIPSPDSDSDGGRLDIHPRDIVGNEAVRKIAGYYLGHEWRPVTRPTLLKWRRERGFPAPLPIPRAGVGPGGQPIELWDAREVRAWCKDHAAKRAELEASYY